jgi:hypothetical protein
MPVAVHDHRVVSQVLQTSHKPTAVDQGRTNALGQRLRRLGILDDVVVKRYDPARAHILEMNGESFRLATAKKAQRRTGYAPTAKTTSDGDDDPKN